MRSCYEGLNVERLFVLKNKIPLSFSGQVTKDKKDANVQMEVTSSVKYGEGKATSLGFDMQIVGNIDRVGVIWFAGIWCIWKPRNDKVVAFRASNCQQAISAILGDMTSLRRFGSCVEELLSLVAEMSIISLVFFKLNLLICVPSSAELQNLFLVSAFSGSIRTWAKILKCSLSNDSYRSSVQAHLDEVSPAFMTPSFLVQYISTAWCFVSSIIVFFILKFDFAALSSLMVEINLSFLKYILTLCDPPNSSDGSLLMADIRSLPGMEGSPVFNEHACLTGVLIRPLRQKTSGAEIQLVIPWEAIVNAASGLLRMWPQNTVEGLCYQEGNSIALGKEPFIDYEKSEAHVPSSNRQKHLYFGSSSPLPIEKAMSSVCLVTIGDGVWASGILLNSQGLILRNVHLLETWRFGKTQISGRGYGTNADKFSSMLEGTTSHGNRVESIQISQKLPSKMTNLHPFANDEKGRYKSNSTYDNHRNK
ncbi:translocon at the outer envelope membrane of chloroplasts [Trifolium repens]|nr:translocon at the outer envelope membrane of chloroplasts [Trifolium repens]